MTRPRGASAASEDNGAAGTSHDQELGSMYDYLAKVILLGPSGVGKSCLLHRFVKSEWRVLSSQTIGVEFASKIVKIGTGARRKRIKLQLWDTAGTERFRSVSRSYYRGAAGAVLVYDVSSQASLRALQPFYNDARALASPNLSMLLVGNKLDLETDPLIDAGFAPDTPSSQAPSSIASDSTTVPVGDYSDAETGRLDGGGDGRTKFASSSANSYLQKATVARDGRAVSSTDAINWAAAAGITVTTEVSALNGEGVDEVFSRLARMILTKIELGDIDPDDPKCGIQYGDAYGSAWSGGASDGGSIKSSTTGVTTEDGASGAKRRRRTKGWMPGWTERRRGLREWEEVFTLSSGRRRGNCC